MNRHPVPWRPFSRFAIFSAASVASWITGPAAALLLLLGVTACSVYALVLPDSKRQSGREHFVDLLASRDVGASAKPVPAEQRLRLTAPMVVVSHDPRPQPKLPLVLLPPHLHETSYRWGDPFVYEWLAENRGDQPITFPTLTADDRISREMPGAKVVMIGLRFADERLRGEPVGLHALYGADSVRGSLIVLAPGERVRVRAAGKWTLSTDSRKVDASEHTYLVKPYIDMLTPLRHELVENSEHSLSVSIRR